MITFDHFQLPCHMVTNSVVMVTFDNLMVTILVSRSFIHNFKLMPYRVNNTVYMVTLWNIMVTIWMLWSLILQCAQS